MQPIALRGVPLAGGSLPAVCAPLVARTREALAAEAAAVAAKQPDLLEWRVDFMEAIADTAQVLRAAPDIRASRAGMGPVGRKALDDRLGTRAAGELPASQARVALMLALAAGDPARLDLILGDAG